MSQGVAMDATINTVVDSSVNTVTGMGQYVKRVLVVDDDLSLRPLWENFFKQWRLSVAIDWAVSCEEAIKMVKQLNEKSNPYVLIIADIFLAGSKTGIELINSIEVVTSQAKKILISSADKNEIVEKFGHLIPDTEIISKPLDFYKVKSLLKKILNKNESNESRIL